MSKCNQRPVGSVYMSLLMVVVALMFLKIPNAMAQADDDTKSGISVGIFLTDWDSKTRFDAQCSSMTGTEVDLEGELGLDTSDSVFRLDGYYRFNQRHRLDFSWFDLSRTGSAPIQRDIEWNDTTLDYQVMDHMAVGVGINSVRMDIGVTKPNASGNLDWEYDGGLLFLKFDF